MDKKDWVKRVSEDGLALAHTPEVFQGDADIVFKALENNGLALQFATPPLRRRPDLVWTAVSNDGMAIRFATAKMRGDRQLAHLALVGDPLSLRYLSKNLRNDLEIILSAVRKDAEAFKYAGRVARVNRSIVAEVLDCDGRALRYAAKNLRGDPSLIEIAQASVDRLARRKFDRDALKNLIALAMRKGFLLYSDIEEEMASFVLSRHELLLITELVKHDVRIDTFSSVPTEEELHSTFNGISSKFFRNELEGY